MENSINSISLKDLAYPVFKLGLNKPETIDGVVFYLYQYVSDEQETTQRLKIVDDLNIEKDSLALRRLKLKADNVDLFKISKAIYFLGDLIKLATPHTWFIDSNGKIFKYIKTTKAELHFHKITEVIPIKTGGAIIEVENLNTRFKALYTPETANKYAGILHYGKSLILYGFYDQAYSKTWRKI